MRWWYEPVGVIDDLTDEQVRGLNFRDCNPGEEIIRLTDGRGVDVAIEALGTQQTFENALRASYLAVG